MEAVVKISKEADLGSSGAQPATGDERVREAEATTTNKPAVDAVKVALSKVKSEKPAETTETTSRERMEKVAKQFQQAINGVDVRFNVELGEDEESSALTFKVVERETGRVVRQFPADELPDLMNQVGNFVDSLA